MTGLVNSNDIPPDSEHSAIAMVTGGGRTISPFAPIFDLGYGLTQFDIVGIYTLFSPKSSSSSPKSVVSPSFVIFEPVSALSVSFVLFDGYSSIGGGIYFTVTPPTRLSWTKISGLPPASTCTAYTASVTPTLTLRSYDNSAY